MELQSADDSGESRGHGTKNMSWNCSGVTLKSWEGENMRNSMSGTQMSAIDEARVGAG